MSTQKIDKIAKRKNSFIIPGSKYVDAVEKYICNVKTGVESTLWTPWHECYFQKTAPKVNVQWTGSQNLSPDLTESSFEGMTRERERGTSSPS